MRSSTLKAVVICVCVFLAAGYYANRRLWNPRTEWQSTGCEEWRDEVLELKVTYSPPTGNCTASSYSFQKRAFLDRCIGVAHDYAYLESVQAIAGTLSLRWLHDSPNNDHAIKIHGVSDRCMHDVLRIVAASAPNLPIIRR